MRLVKRIKTLKHEKEFIKGLIQIFIFDMLLYLLWVGHIFIETDDMTLAYIHFVVVCGALPLLKLWLCSQLHFELKEAETVKLKSINRELINKEKEQSKVHLDTIRGLYADGKNDDALTYINTFIKEQSEAAEFVTDCLCVNNIVDHYKKIAAHKNIEFKYNIPKELHFIECELNIPRKALNTFLGNFLDNGVDALEMGNKENKVLSLEVTKGENYIIYKVSNNGKKIKDVSKIFEARYSTKGTGRGFGLVASERAIESINGQVSVFSTDFETAFEVVVTA